MPFAHRVIVIPKLTPKGTLNIPAEEWALLAEVVGRAFAVSLKVYDVSPFAEHAAEVVPGRDLFIELASESEEAVDLAFRAMHSRIGALIDRYTETNTNEFAAGQR
jgi:hypothetical protein